MNHFHVHHHHGNNEQFHDDLTALEQRLLARIKDMIDPVVQGLLDQAKKNTSFEKSTHLGFQALSAQVETLRGQISAITANGTMTEAEKADISTTTSDLANSLAALQTDVSANTSAATPDAPPADAPPASPPADAPPADAPPASPPADAPPADAPPASPPADPNAPTT